MLRVATFNINGIRAARRRGFGDWLTGTAPDVVALQEVRCPVDALPEEALGGHHLAYDPGTLPGRNGVAVLTREAPAAVRTWGAPVHVRTPTGQVEGVPLHSRSGHGDAHGRPGRVPLARGLSRFAHEGRYIEVDLADRPLTVASLYLPKGGLPAHLQVPGRMREAPDGGARYHRKMRFLDAFARQLARARRDARARGREFLLLGDLNVAHTRLDVAHWRRNQRAVGFLPEERAWIDAQLTPRTLVDVVRRLHPDRPGPWSWWSWLGGTYTRDEGWRIDYQLATPALARTAVATHVDRESAAGVRISDHGAVVVDYDLPGPSHPCPGPAHALRSGMPPAPVAEAADRRHGGDMSEQRPDDQTHRGDGFGSLDRTAEQEEAADVYLDDPSATDDVPWSPPESVPIHSEFPDERAEETIDQRIAQEVPEEGTAYGAPEPEGILGGADDPAGRGPVDEHDMVGGDDPDAIPADRDILDGGP